MSRKLQIGFVVDPTDYAAFCKKCDSVGIPRSQVIGLLIAAFTKKEVIGLNAVEVLIFRELRDAVDKLLAQTGQDS